MSSNLTSGTTMEPTQLGLLSLQEDYRSLDVVDATSPAITRVIESFRRPQSQKELEVLGEAWRERTETALSHSLPALASLAWTLVLDTTWSPLCRLHEVAQAQQIAEHKEIIEHTIEVLKNLGSPVVTNEIEQFIVGLPGISDHFQISPRKANRYPDITCKTFYYDELFEYRKNSGMEAKPCLVKGSPVNIPCGIEVKVNKDKVAINAHGPMAGLYVAVTWMPSYRIFSIKDAYLAYLNRSDFREGNRASVEGGDCSTVKWYPDYTLFTSLTTGKRLREPAEDTTLCLPGVA